MDFIINLPNLITLFRIFFSILIVFPLTYLKFSKLKSSWIMILSIGFLFLTDFFDGYIAKKYNQETTLGKNLDPIADKISFLATLLPLSFHNIIPLPITFLLLTRDCIVGCLRQLEKNSNPNSSLSQIISPSKIAKFKTMILMLGITTSYSNFNYNNSIIIKGLFLIGTLLSLYSMYDYIKKFSQNKNYKNS